MRLAEDMEVVNATVEGESRVDLLLGGHDHDISRRFPGDTDTRAGIIEQGQENANIISDGLVQHTAGDIRIVKSGTDWRNLSLVKVAIERGEDGTVA